jgi:hypothetical protein
LFFKPFGRPRFLFSGRPLSDGMTVEATNCQHISISQGGVYHTTGFANAEVGIVDVPVRVVTPFVVGHSRCLTLTVALQDRAVTPPKFPATITVVYSSRYTSSIFL